MAAPVEQHEKNKHGVEKHFAQHLAANEVRTRDRAVKKVAKWMKARSAKDSGFNKEEMLKLWKGLYYCMWMSDKMIIQEDLADNLAEMVHNMATPKQSFLFYQTFLITIGREWHGIDYLRVDKFYMLFRRVLQQTLLVLQKNSWEPPLVKSFVRMLSRLVFRPSQGAFPSGLRLFLTDIYIEELARASSDELTSERVLWFLEPLISLAAETKEFTLTDSIMTVVFEEIVNQAWLGKEGDSDDEEEEREFEFLEEANKKVKVEGVKAFEELPMLEFDHEAISTMLLKYSSKPEVLSRNRKRIYKTIVLYRNLLQGIHPSQLLKPLKKDSIDRFMKIDNPQRAEMMVHAKKKSKDRLKLFLKRRKERKLQRQGEMRGQRTGGMDGIDSGGEGAMSSSGEMEPETQHLVGNSELGVSLKRVGLEVNGVDKDSSVRESGKSVTDSGRSVSPNKKRKKKSPKGGKAMDDSKDETGGQKGEVEMESKDGDLMEEGGKELEKGVGSSSSRRKTKSLTEGEDFQSLSRDGDSLAKVLFREDVDADDDSSQNELLLLSPRKSKRRSSRPIKSSSDEKENDTEEENKDGVTSIDSGDGGMGLEKVNDQKRQTKKVKGARKSGAKTKESDEEVQSKGNSAEGVDVMEEEIGGTKSETSVVGEMKVDKRGVNMPGVTSEGSSERKANVHGIVQVRGDASPEEREVMTHSDEVDGRVGEKESVEEKTIVLERKKSPKRGRSKRKRKSKEGSAGDSPGRGEDASGKASSAGVMEGDATGEVVPDGASEAKTPKLGRKNRKSSTGTSKKGGAGKSEETKNLYSPPLTRKTVKIALAHNEELPSADYRKRVRASPGIPFDGEKKPQSPAIKPGAPTPIRRSTRRKRKSINLG